MHIKRLKITISVIPHHVRIIMEGHLLLYTSVVVTKRCRNHMGPYL